jgi:hypothetical protein
MTFVAATIGTVLFTHIDAVIWITKTNSEHTDDLKEMNKSRQDVVFDGNIERGL